MDEPAALNSPESDGGASATQLSILLSSATALIDEEFRRSERLDSKSRNQIALVGTFFAVVQAGVFSLFNGALGAKEAVGGKGGHTASGFVPFLAGTGIAAGVVLAVAVGISYRAWRLLDDKALGVGTIRTYLDAARAGNPAVGVKLVSAYADIAEDRRNNNKQRAKSLECATKACGTASAVVAAELILALVAIAVK